MLEALLLSKHKTMLMKAKTVSAQTVMFWQTIDELEEFTDVKSVVGLSTTGGTGQDVEKRQAKPRSTLWSMDRLSMSKITRRTIKVKIVNSIVKAVLFYCLSES